MGNNMEAIYDKKIAKHMFPVEYLPDDYNGPNNGHIKDLISKCQCLYHLPYVPWIRCIWQIQDFPEGAPTPKVGHYCLNFLPKTAWKWKNLWPLGHVVPGAPLDPPMV